MNDPLSDPRATDLLNARPDEIDALRRQYDAAAGNAQYVARGLRAADRRPQWTGAAADRFHASIGTFPHQLDLVTNSYWEVADALQAYSSLVADCQAEFKAALGPGYQTIASRLTAALRAQTHDGQSLSRLAAPGSTATEAQIRRAKAAFDADVRLVTQLEGEIDPHSRRALQILDEFETARDRATHTIALAATIAIPPDGAAPSAAVSSAPVPAPATASAQLRAMTTYANQVMGTPYVLGGGHGAFAAGPNGGLDCSGFVSGVLHSAGFLDAPQTTETIGSQPGIVDGPGRYVTIYDRTGCGDDDHVIIDVNGQFYEEGGGTADGGGSAVHAFTPTAQYLHSFNRILHPVGL